MIDTRDVQILDLLQENGRVTASEISKVVELSIPAIGERMKKLSEQGYIKGYSTVLDHKKAFWLAIPATIGSVIGAWIAVDLNEEIIEKAIAIVMLIMMIVILYKPQRWLKGKEELQTKKISIGQIILFFVIGIYGGFLHMGVGYALLAGIVLGAGYDLVKANAIKVLIIFIWSPVILIVFLINEQVNLYYGLILSIGNVVGALIASRLAVKQGAGFVRWVIIVIILLTAAHVFGLIDIKAGLQSVIQQ